MKTLVYAFSTVVQTLLRMFPIPRRTGLIRIGNPGRDAPVLLTGNFRLTVQRVRRALKGIDAYLLVANSHGINVWCAATGGHLTNHNVISVLKTSGIEALVDHKRVILPQLAATGIEGNDIHRKSGWRVVWGPVYATALPEFLGNGLKKTEQMRMVRFPWPQRIEMAIAWAFPISLLTLLVMPFWKQGVLPLMGFVWGASIIIFMSFPLFKKRLLAAQKSTRIAFFDIGGRGFPILLWIVFMLGLAGGSLVLAAFTWKMMLYWGISTLILLLILAMDLMGSTPMYKSGMREDRLLRIELDENLCKGAAFCEQVCPVNVFEVDHQQKLASLPRQERCVQCGACIVQCTFDALHFRSPTGDVVSPATVRKFKLNFMGGRTVLAHPKKTT